MNFRFSFFFLLIIFCFQKGYAQNYATVVPGDTTYFSHSKYIPVTGNRVKQNCFYVDSSSSIPGGIEYFGYERFYESQSSIYYLLDRKSWLGASVKHYFNGIDIFTNTDNEDVIFETQSSNGTSWIMYIFVSGDYIEATVTGTDTATFFGILDSVKTILLQTKDSGGNLIPGIYNNKTILISQNHGFLKTFSYNLFPNDTFTYTLSGIAGNALGYQHLPVHEIFNFDVGDEFHYKNRIGWIQSSIYQWNTKVILGKTVSVNGDTIKYLVDNIFYQVNGANTFFLHDTTDNPYVILSENTELNGLPEEAIHVNIQSFPYPIYGYSIPYNDSSYFSRSRIFSENYYEYHSTTNELYTPTGMGIFPQRVYAAGLGEIYETDYTYVIRYDSLVYYKKGSEIWGTPLNWSVILGDNLIIDLSNKISAFPNPAKEKFYVQLDFPINKNPLLELFTPAGNLVYRTELTGKINEIPCAQFSSGIYFYRVTLNDGSSNTNKIAIR